MLQRAAGKKKGLFYFVTVRDKQGFLHRVHGHCFKEVEKEGCVRALPPPEEVNKLLRRAASIAKHPATGENRPLYSAQALSTTEANTRSNSMQITSEMIERCMGWRLPDTFNPDCLISFDAEKARRLNMWPHMTNVIHAEQARAMLEWAINGVKPAEPEPKPKTDPGSWMLAGDYLGGGF